MRIRPAAQPSPIRAAPTPGVRLVCVTNKESRHAERVLQATGLAGYFELIIGGDTLAVKKPDAGVLRHVATSLQCELERIVHVGDSYLDVEAARNAGVAAWAVSYGYNAGKPIAGAHPDQLFDNLLQVARDLLETEPLMP